MKRHFLASHGARGGALALLVILGACYTSSRPGDVALQDARHGLPVSVYMHDGTMHQGELLAVTDSSVTLLSRSRVITGSFDGIVRMTFGELPRTYDIDRTRPGTAFLDNARKSSRYPYGISPPMMATLLESTKQSAPARLDTAVP